MAKSHMNMIKNWILEHRHGYEHGNDTETDMDRHAYGHKHG
jgi:hypothetical protein